MRRPKGDLAVTKARIRRVLAAKNVGAADYWRTRGKERFARELAEDGVPQDDAVALLDTIDRDLNHVDLGELLKVLRARRSTP